MRLAAAAEGQKIFGVSASRWHKISHEPDFPKPVAVLGVGAIYDAWDLERYAEQRAEKRVALRRQTEARNANRSRSQQPRSPVPGLPSGLTLP